MFQNTIEFIFLTEGKSPGKTQVKKMKIHAASWEGEESCTVVVLLRDGSTAQTKGMVVLSNCLAQAKKFFNAYSTWYSEVVSSPSINQAQHCLASEIRQDRANSGGMAIGKVQEI